MPRGSGGRGSSGGGGGWGRSSGRSSSKPKTAAHAPVQAAPAAAPPAEKDRSGNQTHAGNLGAAVADGVGWGFGTSIGRRAMDFVFGPPVIRHETVEVSAPQAVSAQSVKSLGASDSCAVSTGAFQDCLNTNESDISKCQFYMDMLSECRRNTVSGITA